jgi:hypothetical protein
LLADACTYVRQALGVDARLTPWSAASRVPYFVTDSYQLGSTKILDRPVVMMTPKEGSRLNVAEMARHLDVIRERADAEAVLVLSAIKASERQQLVARRVAFVVPDNQLYFPPLGIDFREYYRAHRPRDRGELSPSAQAMLISALLKPWSMDHAPAQLGERLGVTPMTVSRGMREFLDAKLGSIVTAGRNKKFRFHDGPAQLWERARTMMRSPVKRLVWLHVSALPMVSTELRMAGLTALAAQTALSAPSTTTYAVEYSTLRRCAADGVVILREPADETVEVQVWAYSPALQKLSKYVDPLSLMLSLRHERDERVMLALDELARKLPWQMTNTQSMG